MDLNDEPVAVVVFDAKNRFVVDKADVETALTLVALLSEDPANWEQAISVWNRYRTPVVCEFATGLPVRETDRDSAIETLRLADGWIVIDFPTKRIFTGGNAMEIGRDARFIMQDDEADKQRFPLNIHLPPWWEINESAEIEEVNQPRLSPIPKPHVDRDVLFGDSLLRHIAERVLTATARDDWKNGDEREQSRAIYAVKLDIHREWLMTPRDDLGGRIPRQLLHGAMEWSDYVTGGQRQRFEAGFDLIAAPDDWPEFATAPMGSQEMYIYFSFCRELLDAAWDWCMRDKTEQAGDGRHSSLSQLTSFLNEAKDLWLNSSYEGGSCPNFIIECDRRRVPIGEGVEIEGIDSAPMEQHVIDCDCPICEMMAEGMFGVGFSQLDGHHLDLDDDFAFSTLESREDWEAQVLEFAEMSAEMDRKRSESNTNDETDDLYSSAWSGIKTEEPLPGDSAGHLKLAFMVAEIISQLHELGAPESEVSSLNGSFSSYRKGNYMQRPQLASELKAKLQNLAEHYPSLTSKSADLQSRIDEAERAPLLDDNESDFPY